MADGHKFTTHNKSRRRRVSSVFVFVDVDVPVLQEKALANEEGGDNGCNQLSVSTRVYLYSCICVHVFVHVLQEKALANEEGGDNGCNQ